MVPRLSGQTSIFGVVFFVSKSLLGITRENNLKKISISTQQPWRTWSHDRILIYRTWPIGRNPFDCVRLSSAPEPNRTQSNGFSSVRFD